MCVYEKVADDAISSLPRSRELEGHVTALDNEGVLILVKHSERKSASPALHTSTLVLHQQRWGRSPARPSRAPSI